MKVEVNGEERDIVSASTVSALVEALPGLGGSRRGVAVALNGEVVSRSRWDEVVLSEGDRLEVLRAVGGGA